jgi:hypothetical protein
MSKKLSHFSYKYILLTFKNSELIVLAENNDFT